MDQEVLQRAYDRERARRKQAEKLLEEKSRELFLSYEDLNESHRQLEQTHEDLQKQQTELVQMINAYASVTDDLNLAAKLQADMLPDPISTATHSAHGYFQPARYIAGDAYDFFMLSDDVFAFYIFDVEGHGTASAMTSFAIHSQLNPKYNGICRRNLSSSSSHSDAVISTVEDLNNTFYTQNTTSKYFTMIYGLLDLNTGTVTWCQAGHPAPILITYNGVSEIGEGGFPVGTLTDPVYETSTYKMKTTERLVVYSDGAVECFSKDQGMFGKARLLEILSDNKYEEQRNLVDKLKQKLHDWNASDEFADDVTVLIIDYKGKPIAS